ncbi:hypothetical protein DKT75_20565 [Leucothrix arctica]|uniref:Uncharacterized protein n=1 Tax=Leucothrix arctica TaxID=1481894 RepID=A0A317C316_9GAMM|nr:hypothetical protein DKT75_20565 [Leucothrix arctica]
MINLVSVFKEGFFVLKKFEMTSKPFFNDLNFIKSVKPFIATMGKFPLLKREATRGVIFGGNKKSTGVFHNQRSH